MKQLNNGIELTNKIVKGANLLADYVGTTLGPKGKNVILKSPGKNPIITKDGVTVARSIELLDPIENLAVRMMKEAADRTATSAGDGTTTFLIEDRPHADTRMIYMIKFYPG